MMARMRMLMIIVSEEVAVAKLMLVGCFSPDLAINIPWKALKLHHAEAASGAPCRVFDHQSCFSKISFSDHPTI